MPATPVTPSLDQDFVSLATFAGVMLVCPGAEPVLARSWRYIGQPRAVPASAVDPLATVEVESLALAPPEALLPLELQAAARMQTAIATVQALAHRRPDTGDMAPAQHDADHRSWSILNVRSATGGAGVQRSSVRV